MKSILPLLLGATAVLLLLILAAAAIAADDAISAYVTLQTRPESVTDIILRSRTTASAVPPERQNGQWLGAGLLAIVLLLIAGLFALMLGGDRLLRHSVDHQHVVPLAVSSNTPHRPAPPPPSPPQDPGANPHASPPTLPTPLTPLTPRTGQLPPWNDEEF